jgi:hypothetical protein
VTWKSPLSAKFLGHFSPIIPPSAAGIASVASEPGGLLWRKLERSKSLVLLQVGGFDVPLATALCKSFLLRILSDSWAGRNPTKGCSADWRRRRRTRTTGKLRHMLLQIATNMAIFPSGSKIQLACWLLIYYMEEWNIMEHNFLNYRNASSGSRWYLFFFWSPVTGPMWPRGFQEV